MTSLYNVKKIVINGNDVTKVAKHYNKNMLDGCKASAAITVQALEEAIEKNRIDCDFEFNKKHETNITYDELIVKQIDKESHLCLDNTYNMKFLWDALYETFGYESDSLVNVQHESVYFASTLKLFDENKFTTLDDNTVYTITTVPSNVKEIILSDKIFNVGFDITTASSSNLVLRYNAATLIGDGESALIQTKGQYKTKLYIKGTYTECKLGANVKPILNIGSTGELHITGNFNLDEAAKIIKASGGAIVYPFGDFAASANLVFGKLVVEKDDLNTTIKDNNPNLATLIRTILHLDDSFTVEFETSNDN